MGDRRRGLDVALAKRSFSEGTRGRAEEEEANDVIWDDGADGFAGNGKGAVVAFGRAGGVRSVEGFLGNDRSLTRGSFVFGASAATACALSSVFRFFCRLAFRIASSFASSSSRDAFFRFALVAAAASLSSALSISLSKGATFLDIRIVEVALGFLS